MPIIVNANTGITAPALSANAVTVGSQGLTFSDATIQTTASIPSVPQIQVFTEPGTFSIPPTTTRVKVTVIGGGAGSPAWNTTGTGYSGPAGASGGTSSFGSYATSTGGTVSARGAAPGSTLSDVFASKYGSGGKLAHIVPASGSPTQFLEDSLYDGSNAGGVGVTVLNAPFPVTSVPVTVGAGGGGGGGTGTFVVGQAASGINGGAGGRGFNPPNIGGQSGGGGGGAAGLTAPYQGTGGTGGQGGAGSPPGTAGQPGAGPFNRFHGGGKGGAGGNIGEGTPFNSTGGGGGFQGIVIVEY